MLPKSLKEFLQLESLSSFLLFAMTILAVIWANSPLRHLHQQFVSTFLFTINEGLMAIFFLLVGLELKQGYVSGQLSSSKQILLPAVAALGGMLVPAMIYLAMTSHDVVAARGWSTPVATDIAFALGVLSLLGRRVPSTLKLFLLAIAIFDDLGAIVIIVIAYSQTVSIFYLIISVILALFLYAFNLFSVRAGTVYLVLGVGLWWCLLYSGIHPTIAGVVLALAVPRPLLKPLETKLHPWVAYLIMPLFALANAGFAFDGLSFNIFQNDVVMGVMLGLFIGKQIGIFSFTWLLVRSGVAKLPEHVSWLSLYGVGILCGIGFTMSLFLGTLSFQHESASYLVDVRIGVLVGSLLSGLVGALVLRLTRGARY